MSDEEFTLGTLSVLVGKQGTEQTSLEFRVSRMAATPDDATMYLLEVVGASQSINALRACLNSDVTCTFTTRGMRFTNGRRNGEYKGFYREEEHGYSAHAVHLGHGHNHALFLSRAPGFLPVVSPESIYAELKKPHHTTPILRSWIDKIEQRLRLADKLEPLFCFRCDCARITATTADLDKIVSEGVKDSTFLMTEELKLVEVG